MKIQISRFPQERAARYSGVYQQQGRMLTDADWNALSEIVKERLNDALLDVIGKGSPEGRPVVSRDPATGRHRLLWGTAYVDGVPARLEPDPKAVLSDPAGAAFEYDKQADFQLPPALPETPYLLYLDIWERTVQSLEDDALRDPGLHGADTTGRSRTMAQVKWGPTEEFDPEDPTQNPPIGSARLTATLRQAVEERDPCEPCADEIEVQGRVGNYLFRLEVHDVGYDNAGAPARIVLKWSSENGAEVAAVSAEPPGFAVPDRVFEFCDGPGEGSVSETHLGWHHPDVLASWSPRRGELVEGFPEAAPPGRSRVRRWDGWCELERDGGTWRLTEGAEAPNGFDRGVRMSAETDAAAHGHVGEGATVTLNLDALRLELAIADNPVLIGDFWLVTVREAAHAVGDKLAADASPAGILHRYMCLARVDGDSVEPCGEGCRRHGFPRLTDLEAEDVCYDNAVCEMPEVRTVQDAIDHLCRARDLRWHNRHLHGWGIVCGLVVECGPDTVPGPGEDAAQRRFGRLTDGYAITCEGDDIVVEDWSDFDIIGKAEKHDEQSERKILDENGNGTLCLVLGLGEEGPEVTAEPHRAGDKGWEALLDGTLLMDFYQHCVADLVTAVRKELSFLDRDADEDSKRLVSPDRMKLTTVVNLAWQFVNPANGAYVFLSPREHEILKELYFNLRILLQSHTFCGMFQAEDFPDYPFAESAIETWFGKGSHTRAKLHPGGKRLYTYGGADRTINVYDVDAGKLVEVVEMPAAEGAEVTAIAFSPEGEQMYAAASVREQDTLFGIARVGDGRHDWEETTIVLCDLIISEMEQSARDPGLLHAIGVRRGFFQLRPRQLREQQKPSPDPVHAFNAVGPMAIDEKLGMAFAASQSDAEAEPDTYDEIRIVKLNIGEEPKEAPAFRLKDTEGRLRHGSDRLALRPARGTRPSERAALYVVADSASPGGDKTLLTYLLSGVPDAQVEPSAELAIEDTQVALAHHAGRDVLLAGMEDGYRLQSIAATGKNEVRHRIPVQIQPADVVIHPERGTVYALNFLSNTITAIPAGRLAPDDRFIAKLVVYRRAVILAFYALVGGVLQYLKDCFCHHLLVKCPSCEEGDRIYLACVDIRDRKVYNICNFSKRKYVKSFPAVEYWLSAIPILPVVKKLVGDFCCSILPDLFAQYQDRLVPQTPAPQTGAPAARKNRVGAGTTRKAFLGFKRTDFSTLLRDQTRGLGLVGRMAGNYATDVLAPTTTMRKGVGKQTFLEADVTATQRELEKSGIEVARVERYDPGLADKHLREYTATPARIPVGSRVVLYEREGKVAYYGLEQPMAPGAGVGVELGPEIERRIAELEARKRELADVSDEREALGAVIDRKAEIESEVVELKGTVDALKQQRQAEEDRLKAIKAEQEELRDAITGLNTNIKSISEEHAKLRLEIEKTRPAIEVEGISEEMREPLANIGVHTLEDLSKASPDTLRRIGVARNRREANKLINNALKRLR